MNGEGKKWDKRDALYINGKRVRPESLMMSYGYNPEWSQGAIKCPIFQTSTFVFPSAEEGKRFFTKAYEEGIITGEGAGLIYSRLNNPDVEILEDRLTLLEDAEDGATFSSGMAAIFTTLMTFLLPEDILIFSEPVYGGTHYLFSNILPTWKIKTVGLPARGFHHNLNEYLYQHKNELNKVKIIYIETPTNPTNNLIDIAGTKSVIDTLHQENKPLIIVDNTFLGPLWQHPLKHGADLVVYSATKFLGGHSDVVAGAVLGPKHLISKIKIMRTFLGTVHGPWTGWLLLRSLETLKLRMTSQMKNARYVADFLSTHPKVERVYYPGLLKEEDGEEFQIYKKQCIAPGSMISFDIYGGEKEAYKFLNSLKLIKIAVSLGGTESLAEHPATMTHSDIPPDKQLRLGITPKMIRLSIGIEHYEDIIADIENALNKI